MIQNNYMSRIYDTISFENQWEFEQLDPKNLALSKNYRAEKI